MNTIYDGTYVIGETSATNFIAGQGIKIDSPSEGVVRIGNDETVLWDSKAWLNAGDANLSANSANINESIYNFETIKIYHARASFVSNALPATNISEYDTSMISAKGDLCELGATFTQLGSNNGFNAYTLLKFTNGTNMMEIAGAQIAYGSTAAYYTKVYLHPYKIIGINRKEV